MTSENDSSDSDSESSDFFSDILNGAEKLQGGTGRVQKNRSMVTSGKLRKPMKSSTKTSFSTSFTRNVKTNNSNLAKSLSKSKLQYQNLQADYFKVLTSKTELAMRFNEDSLYYQNVIQNIETHVMEGLKQAHGFIGHFMEIRAGLDSVKRRQNAKPPMPAEPPKTPNQGFNTSKTQSVCPMVSGITLYRPKIALTRIEMPEQAVLVAPSTPPPPAAKALEVPTSFPHLSEDSDEEQESLLVLNKRRTCNPLVARGSTVARESQQAFYDRVLSEDPMEGTSRRAARAGLRTNPPKDYFAPSASSSSSSDDDKDENRTSLSVKDMEETIGNMSPILKENEILVQENSAHKANVGKDVKRKYLGKKDTLSPSNVGDKSVKFRKQPKRIQMLNLDSQSSLQVTSPLQSSKLVANHATHNHSATTNVTTPDEVLTSVPDNSAPKSLPTESSEQGFDLKSASVTPSLAVTTETGPFSNESTGTYFKDNVTSNPIVNIKNSPLDSNRQLYVTCNRLPSMINAKTMLELTSPKKRTSESRPATPKPRNMLYKSDVEKKTLSLSAGRHSKLLAKESTDISKSKGLKQEANLNGTANTPTELPSLLVAKSIKHLTTPQKTSESNVRLSGTPASKNIVGVSAVDKRTLYVSVDRLPLSNSAELLSLPAKENADKITKRKCAKGHASSNGTANTPTELPSLVVAKTIKHLTTPQKTSESNLRLNGTQESRNIQCKSAVEKRILSVCVDRLPLSKSAEPLTAPAKENTDNKFKRKGAKRQATPYGTEETPKGVPGNRLPKCTRTIEDQIENGTALVIKKELLSPSQNYSQKRTRSALGKIVLPNYKEPCLNVKMRRQTMENGLLTVVKANDHLHAGEPSTSISFK